MLKKNKGEGFKRALPGNLQDHHVNGNWPPVVMLGLLVAVGVAEMFGVALIIPVMSAVLVPDELFQNPIFASVISWLGIQSNAALIIGTVLLLLATFALKGAVLAIFAWYQAKFAFDIFETLSAKILDNYLHQPYAFHLQRNIPELQRNVIVESNLLTFYVLLGSISVLSEILVVFCVTGLLIYIEPLGTLTVFAVVVIFGVIVVAWMNGVVHKAGTERQHAEAMRIKQVQEAIGGIKEVRLFGGARASLEGYRRYNAAWAKASRVNKFIAGLPRVGVELVAVSCVSVLAIVLVWSSTSAEDLMKTIAIFGVAAFRIMPSANRIITGIQSTIFALPSLQKVLEELRLPQPVSTPQPVSEKLLQRAIEFRGVDFTYPEADSAFIKDLSIEIKRGQMVGVIGPSGAGKSTFIDLFLALLEPDRGNVRVDGVDVAGQRSWWQQQIAYVPQSVYLMNDTLRRNVGLGMNEEDVDDLLVMEALKKARLADLVKSLPNGLDTEIGERGSNMSGGQIQRIGIARALFCDRPVLVFDEPTSALDSSNEQHFLDVINQLKGTKTILLVTHRDVMLETCDVIIKFDEGRAVTEQRN